VKWARDHREYAGQSVVLLGVLKGAAIFLSDLSRQLKIDATFDFIGVSSYAIGPALPRTEIGMGLNRRSALTRT